MFTFFGQSSNQMVLHKVGNKQQLGGLRFSHAEYIIQPDTEQTTDDSELNDIFCRVCKQFIIGLNPRHELCDHYWMRLPGYFSLVQYK